MKRTLAIIIITLNALIISAQYPEYAAGIRGGATWSMVSFNPVVPQTTLPTTMHIGAQFRVVSEKYFGVVVELNYTQRGFQDKLEGYSAHRRLDYIELPFLTHITFGRKWFRYFINAGPSISYMIYDKPIETSITPQHSIPIKNRFDYGIAAGMGFEFNTRYGVYTIDARYNFGLGNIFASTAGNTFKNSSNQNITLSVAYLFPFR